MDRDAFELYSKTFVEALAAFDEIAAVAALGSTADQKIRDRWSDHDFALVLRHGAPDRFLDDVSWMPEATRIIASARHGRMYNVAVYDDGHKVEYLVCSEPAASTITVTRCLVLLDRSGVGRLLDEARALTSARARTMAEEACDPINLAIVLLTAAQRVQRGEFLNATSLLAAATDMSLTLLATTQGWELADPLDPRRRLEQLHPDLAKELSGILMVSPDHGVDRLITLVDTTIRPKAPTLNWSGFDRILRRLPQARQ